MTPEEIEQLQNELAATKQALQETKTDLTTMLSEFGIFFSVFGGGKASTAIAQVTKMILWEPEKLAQMGQTMALMLKKYNVNLKPVTDGK